MSTRSLLAFCIGLFILPLFIFGMHFAYAQTEVEQLQSQIQEKNDRLSEIEKEIAQYETELKKVGAEKGTLQKAINELSLEHKKVQADIQYTENKISSTDLEINKLSLQMDATQKIIESEQDAVGRILNAMYVSDTESPIEVFLRNEKLTDFWVTYDTLEQVRSSIHDKVESLLNLKTDLNSQKETSTQKRSDLVDLRSQYNDQKNILTDNTAKKTELLSATKSQEAKYQEMLAEQKTARDQLQSEVQDIESKIQYILDPSTIPPTGTAVFRWPLDKIIITQYFGYTKFALSGAYNGSKHNGVDFGAAVGTQIHAPLSGTVRATGNTDLVPGCYSWGKWVLIDHANGLSSLFAHLSQISVVPGQQLITGELVGYTGATGYVTGPHLHYTLYVQAAVQVKKFNEFKSVTGCGPASSPFAPIEAYLNPLDYLPPV